MKFVFNPTDVDLRYPYHGAMIELPSQMDVLVDDHQALSIKKTWQFIEVSDVPEVSEPNKPSVTSEKKPKKRLFRK